MAIEFEKPQPLMLGDKAHYTLSSYDPVTITVNAPFTTEEDVDLALDGVLRQMGATRENLADSAWLAEHFQGISDAETLRQVIRSQVADMNARFAEQQKVESAVGQLAKRLQQAIPAAHLARYRQGVQMSFEQQLASEGMTVDQFLMRSGATRAEIELMYDHQAKTAAEQEAALDAYAREKKLTVSEEEFGHLLGIPAGQMDEVINQAKVAGQYSDLKDAALHAKAAQSVVAEANCTYRHETEAEARVRVARAVQMREQYERGAEAGGKGTGFELV